MTSEKLFVHARTEDGDSHVVGVFERTCSASGRMTGSFGYAASWLRRTSNFPLDPNNMPLVRNTLNTTKRGGLFGPLADALPDRWGRRLISLDHPGVVSPVRMLLMSGPDRVGCLAFSETPQLEEGGHVAVPQGVESIADIADAFERIERHEDVSPRLKALYRAGISIGGARPKAVVQHDGSLWIAKFEKHDDEWDQCVCEHAAMRLASRAGIAVSETRLLDIGKRKVVLVRRFDRGDAPDHAPTAHFVSALSLLDLDESDQGGGYPQIAGVLRRHSRDFEQEAGELFRRMVFNVLIGNRDDHLKNHAMIRSRDGWRLSPAYDVLPQPDMEEIQAIAVGTMGVLPTRSNLLSRAGDFGLSTSIATDILDEVQKVVAVWEEVFRHEGADDRTIRRVASAFRMVDVPSPKLP